MTTFQQFILFFLIMIGSSIFVSIGTVLTRKHVFESRFKHVVQAAREGRKRRRSFSTNRSATRSANLSANRSAAGSGPDVGETKEERKAEEQIDAATHPGPRDPTFDDQKAETANGNPGPDSGRVLNGEKKEGNEIEAVPPAAEDSVVDRPPVMFASTPRPDVLAHRRVLSFVGVGAHPNSTAFKLPHSNGLVNRFERKVEEEVEGGLRELRDVAYPPYLTRATTGRNAQFFGLSRVEREHLGGVEYRAITMLAWIVPIYFVLWQLLGCLGLAAYMAHNKAALAEGNGINPW